MNDFFGEPGEQVLKLVDRYRPIVLFAVAAAIGVGTLWALQEFNN